MLLLLFSKLPEKSVRPAVFDLEEKLIPEKGIGGEIVNTIATWADRILDFFGVSHNPALAMVLYSILVLIISIAIGMAFRMIVLGAVRLICSRIHTGLMQEVRQNKLISKLTDVIPPIAYIVFLHLTYIENTHLIRVLSNVTFIYLIFVCIRAVNKFIDVMWLYFDRKQNKRQLPLKSIAQLFQALTWIIGVIIVIGIIVNKSPGTLLAGMGAFAAVIMLVFKNNILSVVAGVQLSEEDALHVGDWIKVHGTEADGIVMEANLISVKVKNFDNTTTFLPPYSLISGSFTNYRSMLESKARRIYRTYLIDADSLKILDDKALEKYKSIPLMNDWITRKQQQAKEGKEMDAGNPDKLANGSLETNLGLFRAYIKMYLDQSKYIDHNLMCMVGTDQQTSGGIPLQLFCYTNTSVWADYMSIQSLVFEHLAVMLACFDLVTYELPSGRDIIAGGAAAGNGNPGTIFGETAPLVDTADTPPAASAEG